MSRWLMNLAVLMSLAISVAIRGRIAQFPAQTYLAAHNLLDLFLAVQTRLAAHDLIAQRLEQQQ